MEARARRIVETAIELAEEGGFEAVRLRDVAEHADVALGTLYRRFASKEAILVAALELESEELEKRLAKRAQTTGTPLERVTTFFAYVTPALCRRPNLARAILRAVVSGNEEISKKSARFHARIAELVSAAIRGGAAASEDEERASADEKIAYVLQQVWFAGLVGWMGGIHSQAQVVDQVNTAAELILGTRRDKR